jgi:hypothetical protein
MRTVIREMLDDQAAAGLADLEAAEREAWASPERAIARADGMRGADMMFAPHVRVFWPAWAGKAFRDPVPQGFLIGLESPVYQVVTEALKLGVAYGHGGYDTCYLRGDELTGEIVWAPIYPWMDHVPFEAIMDGVICPPVGRLAADGEEFRAVTAVAAPDYIWVPHCSSAVCPSCTEPWQVCRGIPFVHTTATGRAEWQLGTHQASLRVWRPGGLAAEARLVRWKVDLDEDLVVDEVAIQTEGPAAARRRHIRELVGLLAEISKPYGNGDVAALTHPSRYQGADQELVGLGVPEAVAWLDDLGPEDSTRGVFGAPRLA